MRKGQMFGMFCYRNLGVKHLQCRIVVSNNTVSIGFNILVDSLILTVLPISYKYVEQKHYYSVRDNG